MLLLTLTVFALRMSTLFNESITRLYEGNVYEIVNGEAKGVLKLVGYSVNVSESPVHRNRMLAIATGSFGFLGKLYTTLAGLLGIMFAFVLIAMLHAAASKLRMPAGNDNLLIRRITFYQKCCELKTLSDHIRRVLEVLYPTVLAFGVLYLVIAYNYLSNPTLYKMTKSTIFLANAQIAMTIVFAAGISKKVMTTKSCNLYGKTSGASCANL